MLARWTLLAAVTGGDEPRQDPRGAGSTHQNLVLQAWRAASLWKPEPDRGVRWLGIRAKRAADSTAPTEQNPFLPLTALTFA